MPDLKSFVPPFTLANRYEVAAEIGRGGFAVVFRARDRDLGLDVAIKILRTEALPHAAFERFSQEMEVTARLRHPHIVRVFDSGVIDGVPYFVMQLVLGPTLEARLAIEQALPVGDALTITRQMGEALAFAHANGVVHRDVKPANVLLAEDGARLSDFGIARVLTRADTERITSGGFTVGTTQYMSPEQLCAEPGIGARSDQYSLALVCYEMLTGVQPHVASTVDSLRALRLAGAYTAVVSHRPSVPRFVDAALVRSLAPNPADRFDSVEQFLGALAADRAAVGVNAAARGSARSRRRIQLGMAGGALVAAAAVAAWTVDRRTGAVSGAAPEGAPSVALLPVGGADSAFASETRREIESWRDVALRPAREARVTSADAERLDDYRGASENSGATIVLRPTVAQIGDSVRLMLTVYDSRTKNLARVSRAVTARDPNRPAALRTLVARALAGAGSADSAPGLDGLRDAEYAAARSYVNGWQLLRRGELDSAATAFGRAADVAPRFAQASLWSAQVGEWQLPKDPTSWRAPAQRAMSLARSLDVRDSLSGAALVALAAGDPPRACVAYRDLVKRDADSFAGWFGLGECQRTDSMVVRDARAPGRWRFRSSMWGALAAYNEALARLPSARMAPLFERVVPITYASGNNTRMGVAMPPDSGHFIAVPSLGGDTIELHPIEMQRVVGMKPGTMPETFSRAVQRGRAELLAFTKRWVERAPASPNAWYRRAYALELTGAFDAPDELNSASGALIRAGALSPNEDLRARLDVARVRVAVRRGAFDDATRLARSAIGGIDAMSARTAAVRLPLAAFLLDVDATVRLMRLAATSEVARAGLPEWAAAPATPWLADSLRSFGVRAALGVCEGLASRRQALEAGLRRETAAADLTETRERLLHDVFRMAVPCLGPAVVNGFPRQRPLDDAAAALATGNPGQARKILGELERERRGMARSTLTVDAVLAESLLMLQAGDTARAFAQLRTSIEDVARMSPFTLEYMEQAAALARVRALVLSR